MERYLKIGGVVNIVIGVFHGVRYITEIFHYARAGPEEDCPPPFRLVGDLGFVLTGGSWVPLWLQDSPNTK